MDGLLVIDKPAGPTSHDVVARMRRVLRERRVGHTGTLDPIATGVLPLVVGRATRLARFLSSGDKTYDAVIRFGFATDTGDATGARLGGVHGNTPSYARIDEALQEFRGTFLQQPPDYSAKKIAGTRSYELARAGKRDVRPNAVPVTVPRIEVRVLLDGDSLTLSLDCSAGFYVRSLAHDLGERLGVGAHLAALRRTRSGDCALEDAVPLDVAERDPAAAACRLVPLAAMLPRLPSARLTVDGVRRARHGRDLGPRDFAPCESRIPNPASVVRLLDATGDLIGIAEPATTPDLLHPFVVLV